MVNNDAGVAAPSASQNKFIGSIEDFTLGEDFPNYLERMENLLLLNGIENGKKCSVMYALCGAELYEIIKTRIAPKKTNEITFTELTTELNKYFKPTTNIIAERFRFYSRQQKIDEIVNDYIVELKSLSKTCEFGTFLENALRDKLVQNAQKYKCDY